jgi:hypothetical protein|tara:strand:- start:63 stop:197 length:135 start_codon:yes stop_codon:yes gene_type:complete
VGRVVVFYQSKCLYLLEKRVLYFLIQYKSDKVKIKVIFGGGSRA